MHFFRVSFLRTLSLFGVMAVAAFMSITVRADVIDVDMTGVDPRYQDVFANAEAVWEERIQNYSTELPQVLLFQLSKLTIVASTPFIDGPGGILGQAGPRGLLTMQTTKQFETSNYAFPVLSAMEFDIEDLPIMEAGGYLQKVIIHEMGHAMGFGSLWTQNNLIGPVNGVGTTHYINGEYAIEGYRRDIGNPFAVFVPIEQRGGPGTALAHWADVPPFFNQVFTPLFKKEILTGFAGDAVPDTDPVLVVYGDYFIAEATWGAMADLGWEVSRVNDNSVDPEPRTPTNRWPKTTGNGTFFDPNGAGPFQPTVIDAASGLTFEPVHINIQTKALFSKQTKTKKNDDVDAKLVDPYGLRNQAWVK